MLSIKPDLTPEDIIDLFKRTSEEDNFTGKLPNNIWGQGKLNLQKIFKDLLGMGAVDYPLEYNDIKIFPNPFTDFINISNPNGKTMIWQSQRTRTWIAGENTTFNTDSINGVKDDIYSVTGSGSGKSFNGTTFSANITEPLIISLQCRFITKGKAELSPGEQAIRYIDYGDGTCDAIAAITINGVTYYREIP